MDKERLNLLDAKFRPQDLEWRIQQSGVSNGKPWAKVLCYVTSRAIQNRLDEVCGKDGWSTELKNIDGAYICRMGINVGGQWVFKEDGADETKIEATKGGISGAIKRAGVQWGIGRYLYDLDEGWAVFCDNGMYSYYDKTTKQNYKWNPPKLPDWALPSAPITSAPKKDVEVCKEPEMPKLSDNYKKLAMIIDKYEMNLQGTPYKLSTEALKKGDEGQIVEMIERCRKYLANKNIVID